MEPASGWVKAFYLNLFNIYVYGTVLTSLKFNRYFNISDKSWRMLLFNGLQMGAFY